MYTSTVTNEVNDMIATVFESARSTYMVAPEMAELVQALELKESEVRPRTVWGNGWALVESVAGRV